MSDLPKGWTTVPLAEAFPIISNGKSVRQDKSTNGLPITRIETIATGIVAPDRCGYADLFREGNEKWLLKPGDILLSHINSPHHVGRVAIYDGHPKELIHGMNLLRLQPDRTLIDPWFALQYFRSPRFLSQLRRYVNQAVNQASVSIENLKTVPFPLPPLDEQGRIATILDKADSIQEKCLRATGALGAAANASFLSCFRDSPTARLDEVADLFGGGSLPVGKEFTNQPGGYFHVKVSDMNLPGNEEEVHSAAVWSSTPGAKASTAPAGAVIVPKRGGSIGTNKKRMLARPALLDPNLMAIAARPDQLVPVVLYHWFRNFDLNSIASGSTVPQLNKKDLVGLMVPRPALERQEEFATIVLHQRKLSEQAQHRALSAQRMIASLKSRAFRGEL